jgi:hypothetical protein
VKDKFRRLIPIDPERNFGYTPQDQTEAREEMDKAQREQITYASNQGHELGPTKVPLRDYRQKIGCSCPRKPNKRPARIKI